jgi:hypothetical protein
MIWFAMTEKRKKEKKGESQNANLVLNSEKYRPRKHNPVMGGGRGREHNTRGQ